MNDVSAIVVAADTPSLTESCLTRLRAALPTGEIVLVDNGESNEWQLGAPVNAVAVRPGANIGYTRGTNLGTARATREWLLLVHTDVDVQPDAVERMRETAAAFDASIVGAQLMTPQGGIDHAGVVFDGLEPMRLTSHKFIAGRDRLCPATIFALALVRREVWAKLGGFDEALVLDYMEGDLCLRARELGERIAICALGRSIHHRGKSPRPMPVGPQGDADRVHYAAKWQGRIAHDSLAS